MMREPSEVDSMILEAIPISYRGHPYRRLLVRTPVVRSKDPLLAVISAHLARHCLPGDIAFVSEKLVAITQGRLVRADTLQPRPLAHLLSRFVVKSPYGAGLRLPVNMEMALREVGTARIMAAAVCGAIGKLLHRPGTFYRVAGRRVAAIDGPNPHTLPPYGKYIILCPLDPSGVATKIGAALGCAAAIVDCNDVGSEVLGATEGLDEDLVRSVLSDNPMGQGHQRTPMGLIRPMEEPAAP